MSIKDRRAAFTEPGSGRVYKARWKANIYVLFLFAGWLLGSYYFLFGWGWVIIAFSITRRYLSSYDEIWLVPSTWPLYKQVKSIKSSSLIVLPAFISSSGDLIT